MGVLTELDLVEIHCSGMPECKLGLNDRVLLEAQGRATKGKAIDLEDIKFHQYATYLELCCHSYKHFGFKISDFCVSSHSQILV